MKKEKIPLPPRITLIATKKYVIIAGRGRYVSVDALYIILHVYNIGRTEEREGRLSVDALLGHYYTC